MVKILDASSVSHPDYVESGCYLTIGTNKTIDKVDMPAFTRLVAKVCREIDNYVIQKRNGVVTPFDRARETVALPSIEAGGKYHRIHAHIKFVFFSKRIHCFLDSYKLRAHLQTVWPGLYIKSHRFVTEASLARYTSKGNVRADHDDNDC